MYDCIDCVFLDKSRKQESSNGISFRYGCNNRGSDNYIPGWCRDDKDLKNSHLGCSDWREIKKREIIESELPGQLTIFDL